MLQEIIDKLEEKNIKEVNDSADEKKAYVAVVCSNPEDEPSERYVKNKCKKMESHGIHSEVVNVNTDKELTNEIERLNNDERVTAIIVQAPLGKNITLSSQKVFDLVRPEKDIDRLNSCFYYDKEPENLPLTALGIYRLIEEILKKENINDEKTKVLFYGNGLTTNKRLFLKMFDEGVTDCRIINSKTPKHSKDELIKWADIIVSSTGIPEVLKCNGKIVISPTITKTKEGFRSDLEHNHRNYNKVHNVLGGIGKLTTSNLLRRALRMVD